MGRHRRPAAADSALRRDRIIGLFYLAVVPLTIVGILILGWHDHRTEAARAKRIANRAESIAATSCTTAATLHGILMSILPAKDPPNLTPAQKVRLNVFRQAATNLGQLDCKLLPKGS